MTTKVDWMWPEMEPSKCSMGVVGVQCHNAQSVCKQNDGGDGENGDYSRDCEWLCGVTRGHGRCGW